MTNDSFIKRNNFTINHFKSKFVKTIYIKMNRFCFFLNVSRLNVIWNIFIY